MALDEKFFPEDQKLITRFDNFLIKKARIVGEAYQERTRKSYKDLVRSSYLQSTITSIPITFSGYFLAPIIPAVFYFKYKFPSFSTPLEEEISLESTGDSKYVNKFIRAFMLSYACFCLPKETLDLCSSNNFYEQATNLSELFFGISYGFHAFGDYLSKSGLPKPPKEKAKEKAKRRFGIMLPEPSSA